MIPKIITSCVKNSIKGIKMQVWISKLDFGYDYKSEKPFYLRRPLAFIIDDGRGRIRACIPKDFQSDGCSIPRIFWILIGCPHTGKYIPASIVHDYILQHPDIVNYDRKLANQTLKTLLLQEGVEVWKAQVMYLGAELWQWYRNFKTRKWK